MMLLPGAGIAFFIGFLVTGKMNPTNYLGIPPWMCWGLAILEIGSIIYLIVKIARDSRKEKRTWIKH